MLRDQARNLPDYRLNTQLGAQASLFVGGDYAIPGFYTQRGYQKLFVAQGAELVSEILRDNWVLGEGDSFSAKDLGRLLAEMEQLYFRDYAMHWSEAITQLNVLPAGRSAESRVRKEG